MQKNKKLSALLKKIISFIVSCWLLIISYSPIFAKEQKGLKIGIFEGLGAYEPEISQDVTSAGSALANILSNIIGFLTILAGIYFIIYFMLGGLKWLTSSGKAERVEEAKKSMTNAAIGLIIVVAAYAIIFIVGLVLGIDILNIQKALQLLGPGTQ